MEYTLKDKITVTKDFINELAEKSWHDIEHIQNQLANLADTEEGKKVGKLLSSLLTSYYVFVGGLENIDNVSVLWRFYRRQALRSSLFLPCCHYSPTATFA